MCMCWFGMVAAGSSCMANHEREEAVNELSVLVSAASWSSYLHFSIWSCYVEGLLVLSLSGCVAGPAIALLPGLQSCNVTCTVCAHWPQSRCNSRFTMCTVSTGMPGDDARVLFAWSRGCCSNISESVQQSCNWTMSNIAHSGIDYMGRAKSSSASHGNSIRVNARCLQTRACQHSG